MVPSETPEVGAVLPSGISMAGDEENDVEDGVVWDIDMAVTVFAAAVISVALLVEIPTGREDLGLLLAVVTSLEVVPVADKNEEVLAELNEVAFSVMEVCARGEAANKNSTQLHITSQMTKWMKREYLPDVPFDSPSRMSYPVHRKLCISVFHVFSHFLLKDLERQLISLLVPPEEVTGLPGA